MSGLFYNLGRLAGPKIRKAKWAYLSATAPEAEVVEAEFSVGADMAREIHRQFIPSGDPLKNDLLSRTGAALVRRLKNNRRQYLFECIQVKTPQAFCLPGGFIFLSDSLIDLCEESVDQIAFICAHEMAHIIQGDVMERALSQSLIKAAMRAGHLRACVTGPMGRLGIQFLESEMGISFGNSS
jgi:Zn-dependent protease with chaperone function